MASEQPLPMPAKAEVHEAPAPTPKHRACDECRSRKLACTKEPDGCSRCKREAITCHYSPQKQMGRPRKRPREDNEPKSGTPAEEPAAKTAMAEAPPNVADPGMALIDLLLGEENLYDMSSSLDFMGLSTEAQVPDFHLPMETPKESQDQYQFSWGGDVGNFDFGPSDQVQGFSNSDYDLDSFLAATEPSPPVEQVPALSPHNSNYASTPDSPATTTNYTSVTAASPALPTQRCGCSGALYLALTSLHSLEKDVTGAVRQARLAAKTAYEVVNCSVCAPTIEQLPLITAPIAMQAFQNKMLLGTLIPSIVHAYSTILRMADAESQAARAERRQLVFKLNDLGGIWGGISGGGPGNGCNATQQYNFREMDPTLWRLTVRALLKLDVYGLSHNVMMGDEYGGPREPFHLGLRDIVNLMDAKSKARHAFMDSMVANGVALPDCSSTGLQTHKQGETPTCQKIIDIARQSIDNLVIP
ncbi:hypothetical protein Micbo1qcDRAFT_27244 [Microdochium bolleyi]|uniref:Zn(2)-C6 fungal-type domain-containing protein n=1 Tax=Microdochium bolleyi TaxID=196109 RepID=A0A136JEH7_9PEZI|nr:hypothetical protein Micbo1qcDRAFT_27244 [Microdochium bolleyi]